MKNHVALACLLVAVAVGCGQEASNPEAAPTTEPAATPAAPPAVQNQAAPAPAPAKPADPSSTSGAIEAGEALDAADESVPTADTLLAAAVTQTAPETNSRWQQNVHYKVLVPAQPTNAPPGRVEVTEMFWYGCAHCYALDPFLANWKKKAPAYVEFTHVPVTWGAAHRAHARLYYTLMALGKEDELRDAVFKEIQVNHNMLASNDPIETEQMQMQFVRRFDISEEDFRKAYNSFAVETNLQRAEQLVRRYKVAGVPLMIVNGKYTADVSTAGGQSQLIELITDLAAREQKKE